MRSLTKQAQQVLDLIDRDGHVTRLTAMHYGVANVTARITELRNAGHFVVCNLAKDANGSRYGRWSIPA
jgi:hypothetical protein